MSYTNVNIPAFEVKVFETLPVYLQEKVNRLLKDCFHTTTRTPEEQAKHEDRYCSNEDIIGHVVALHDDKVFGVIIVLKRNISFQGQEILLGGIGGVCTDKSKRRMGIATMLLKTAMEHLRKNNCDVAYLCADIHNPGMVRLYGQVGFVILNKPHTYLGKSGKRYTDTDGMIAPVSSQEVFMEIMRDKEPFDIGRGNW